MATQAQATQRLSFKGFVTHRERPVALRTLAAGDEFRLHWEGGQHPTGTAGVLLHINECRARVRVHGKSHVVDFADDKGGRHFEAPRIIDTDWSPGTLVYKTGMNEGIRDEYLGRLARKGGRVKFSFKPSKQYNEEAEEAKEAMMAKGNGKGAKVAKAKKPAGPVSPDGKCMCGCAEPVNRRFKPGHDARHFGRLKKIKAGEMEFKDLPKSVQLRVKDKAGAGRELATH